MRNDTAVLIGPADFVAIRFHPMPHILGSLLGTRTCYINRYVTGAGWRGGISLGSCLVGNRLQCRLS
jgi:hypothetical protein